MRLFSIIVIAVKLFVVALIGLQPGAGNSLNSGQQESGLHPLRPPMTESPQQTLTCFLNNALDAAQRFRDRAPRGAVQRSRDRVLRCLDLSQIPPVTRADVGGKRALLLLEVLSRLDPDSLANAPDLDAVSAQKIESWTIPDTEIIIKRTEEGIDAGRFQFSSETIANLPAFYQRIKHRPIRDSRAVGLYDSVVYAPGILIPRNWISALPEPALHIVGGQTVWQWVLMVFTVSLTLLTIFVLYYWGRRFDLRDPDREVPGYLGRIIATFAIVVVANTNVFFVQQGINLSDTLEQSLILGLRAIATFAIGWAIMLILNALGEMIISARSSSLQAIDSQLIRIVVRILGILAIIYFALVLADSYGIPAAPLIASLGVGGLAVALAIRPTLENIVGGFILFADQPVRVGEFCKFDDKMGTVEAIGLRSIRLRALDRTVITVPNAEFAQLQIVNFTRRDRMLMQTTLGLRYETTPDQLRYVLTKLRELFIAHPEVSPEPARARFASFGDSSLNIDIFIYVTTHDYNAFLGVAEDLNLRILDIVEEAGTGFAFPSQTAYLARDTGLDTEKQAHAESEVEKWRSSGELPFPNLDPDRVQTLDGILDYPPKGSPIKSA